MDALSDENEGKYIFDLTFYSSADF